MDSPSVEYLTGFFEGDGCINIGGNGRAWRAQLVFSNTVWQAVEDYHERWGGHTYVVPSNWRTTVPRVQQSYAWYLTGQAATPCLRDMLPFLRIKREQAENALEFLRVLAQGKARSVDELKRLVARHKALSFYSRTSPSTPLEVADPQGEFIEIVAKATQPLSS